MNSYANNLKEELEKRQIGGSITIDMIQDEFTSPLLDRLEYALLLLLFTIKERELAQWGSNTVDK